MNDTLQDVLGTIGETWLGLITDYEHRRHCRTAMYLHVLPVLKVLKVDYVRDLRPFHVDSVYVALLAKGFKPKTLFQYMKSFEQFCRYLVRRDLLYKMPPFPQIEVPETYKPWIDPEKQALILSKVPDEFDNKLLMETFLQGGHRPQEVISHKKRDLFVEEGYLYVHEVFNAEGKLKAPKGNKILRRQISLDLYLRLLNHAEGKADEDFLFLRSGGRAYSYDSFYHLWTNAATAAGVKIAPQAGSRRSKASQVREKLEKQTEEELRGVLDHHSDIYKAYARNKREKI